MAMPKKTPTKAKLPGSAPDGFINVPVSRDTRKGLHDLKDSMGVSGQAEVIEKLVAIGVAIQKASR